MLLKYENCILLTLHTRKSILRALLKRFRKNLIKLKNKLSYEQNCSSLLTEKEERLMKKRLLITSSLALLLGLGVAGGLSLAKKETSKPVEKVDAVSAGQTVYLHPNSDWRSANARFAMYCFGNGDTWVNLTAVANSSNYYSATIPSGYTSIIMCRMDPATSVNNWDNKWDQSPDLTLSSSTGNTYRITGWSTGTWAGTYGTSFPALDGYYLVGSRTSYGWSGATRLTDVTGDNLAELYNYSANNGEKIKVRSYFADTGADTWSNYNGGTQPFGDADNDQNFEFTKSLTVNVYAKDESGLKFYVSEKPASDGYYLVGDSAFISEIGKSGTAWMFATGAKMNGLSGEGNKADYVLTVTKLVTVRVKDFFSEHANWLSFGTTYDGTDGITTVGANVTLAAGTYSIYVNNSFDVYVIKGVALDAFCTEFLTEIENVCSLSGATVLNDLKATWSHLTTFYANVFASDKATIVAIGFNGGSDADDAHKVVKAYHYIVTKYGTSNCPDFIWGQTIAGSGAVKVAMIENVVGNNDTTLIIALVSIIAISAVGGYFFFRRKRHE